MSSPPGNRRSHERVGADALPEAGADAEAPPGARAGADALPGAGADAEAPPGARAGADALPEAGADAEAPPGARAGADALPVVRAGADALPVVLVLRMDSNPPIPPRRVFIHSLGCQMNEYDAGKMRAELARDGWVSTDDPENADLIVVNTCSVREKAVDKMHSA